MPFAPQRVLIVDDEALVANVLQHELEQLGHVVVGRAADGAVAVQLAARLTPDVVVMDIAMPDVDGLEATRRIQAECPRPVVLLTAHDDPDLVAVAGEAGAGAYLVKPPSRGELARAISIAVARFADWAALRRANAELEAALATVHRLRGLLPICAHCLKIRDESGDWQRLEEYISARSEARFSHGICRECLAKHFPEVP
jgi:response regulator NasT